MANRPNEPYNPLNIEPEIYELWEREHYFQSNPDKRIPYCIVIPPPNVTGALHMGHALNNSIQDVLIRYHRMKGFNTLWLPGTDHAGVATQSVVERKLWEEKKLTRYDLGRKGMLELIWSWKQEYGNKIINQLKALGCSCDWSRTRFTMDPGMSKAVRVVFVALFHDGLIYRGKRLINWCINHRTALSNDELIYKESQGHFWHIKYIIADNPSEGITVATTRPETLLGDTAVAVHPEDERYKKFIGRQVILPLLGRKIPVIADPLLADPERGTGAVKVTPAHDPNDYECSRRNNLPMINILNGDGTLNNEAGPYRNMTIQEARKKVVQDLEKEGLLVKVEDHIHQLAHCYRCDSVIEPLLSDQWFVKMQPLVKLAREAGLQKEVVFYPQTRLKQFLDWLDSTPDWCISRQIWWGHRIPVWYCISCNAGIKVDDSGEPSSIPPEATALVPPVDNPMKDPEFCPSCGGRNLVQDPDVLDTWFSSQLWPISTLGWPEKGEDLNYYYPTSVLVTARDIIALWVARMIMMGKKFMRTVPFRHVYVHGTILDEKGDIMSKSRGNGVDPLMLIKGGIDEVGGRTERYKPYGADALRYGILSMASAGQDIRLIINRKRADDGSFDVDIPKIEEGRRFCNKIWQVTRGVIIPQCSDMNNHSKEFITIEDRWLRHKLHHGIQNITRHFDNYEIGEACNALYKLLWDEFCSWYVEIVKPRLWGENGAFRLQAQTMLLETMTVLLRMLHPIMPFITEKLWIDITELRKNAKMQNLGERIISAPWPDPENYPPDETATATCELVLNLAKEINSIKAHNLPIKEKKLPVVFLEVDKKLFNEISIMFGGLSKFTGVEKFSLAEEASDENLDGSAVGLSGPFKIYVPLKGISDLAQERERINKKIKQIESKIQELKKKLQNPEFLSKAKPHVIEKEREREKSLSGELEKLKENLQKLTENTL